VAGIRLEQVSKHFSGGVVAVDGVDLEIDDGEFMVFVGPSGCGKTTLLRMIAGLEEVTEGTISIAGEDVTEFAPRKRDIAMVFQTYALYPHMSVRQNIGYGLKVRKTPKLEAQRRVQEVAALLGLDGLLNRKPAQLSGGQRQRVAMGRAIVREPKAFLMDEPLSNLDAKLRVGMRASLAQLHGRLGVTTIYVTHDQTEAMTLGQRVAVMRDGRILQVDTPQRLYHEPVDLFVAAFIGTPSMNLVEATIDGGEIAFGQFRIPLDPVRRPRPGAPRKIVLGVRPEAFEDGAFASPDAPRIEAKVTVLEELGSDAHAHFYVDAPRVSSEEVTEAADGEEAMLLVEEKTLFNARLDSRTAARIGDTMELAVDPARFHFFDPETRATLLSEAAVADPPEPVLTNI
jgi:multiple sugar transport system ATP-binding protein